MLPDFDDLDVFFDLDGFAQPVLVGPEWEEVEIPAIFSNTYQSVRDNGSTQFSSTGPNLLVKSEDVKALDIGEGTRAVVNDDVYTVADVQPENAGMSRLILNRAKRGKAC